MATLKEFEEALKAAGNTAALEILEALRERDRANRSIRPARRLTGRRMTPELAAEILHLHRTTELTQQEIAFQLGVNQGRVNEVIKRGKWLDGDPNAPEAMTRDKAVQRAKAGVGVSPRRARPAAHAAEGDPPRRTAGKSAGKGPEGRTPAGTDSRKKNARGSGRAADTPAQLLFDGL